MKKVISARSRLKFAILLALGTLLTAGARAQQSSSGSTQTAPAGSSQQANPAKATAGGAAPKSATASAAKPSGSAAQGTPSPAAKGAPPPALATDKQKDSYAFGLNIGMKIVDQPIDLDITPLLAGVRDALLHNKPQLTDEQVRAALEDLSKRATAKEDAMNQVIGESNLKEGQQFLAGNKTKDGVVELPSGLQYKIITAGDGPKPTADDTVVCDYSGTLISGQTFDSSYERGQPASFPVKGVIKGWTEALQLMPVGSKWQLFVPPDLAYGSRGAGPDIGPNATLIFEVELHSIKGK
jgi:FKBP-type peptidyl-prolyl cis-trans isomerase FklB